MNAPKQNAKEIFAEALVLTDSAERRAFLERVCVGNALLREEVESLLNAHEQAGDFLGKTMQLSQPDFTVERTGTMIGRYKLLQKIGEGGFGIVYMAEQVEPVQRKVALKIIKAGMDTREVVARFEAERQALALMDHPNIARVFDAGATEAGRPYFVMELVNGIPITEYCDREQLSTTERLHLFMKVCHAVQHAHQKGIIHRDIKPNNVLVTLHDVEPVPKVIDFGVAKALGQKLTEKTLFTAFQHMIGTPAYMSPEQAELSGLDIDTRADIYSLGVLLYELLTGETPFDAETLRKAALDEVRRMIRETEPPKPSTRLQTLGDKLTDVAKRRQTEPQTLRRLVRGDLDWIVMKCLEKDRKRRYETADALVTDVLRHLRNHPILARPPTMFYAFGKHLHRHPLRVAVTSAAVITLVLSGVAAYLVEWRRGESYRRLAEENRRLAMESRERLARVYAGNGVRTVDDGDPLASLAWFAEALKVRRDGPVHDDRVRIATILRQSPRLVHAWTHNGPVDFVDISKDGKLAASASRDHTARVWNLANGEPATPPLSHSNAVTCVCFSPDSKLLLTAGKDGVARVWNVLTGQPMCEPLVHPDSVEHAAYSPLGNLVATAGSDGAARLWNPATGKLAVPEMRHAASLFSVSFSEDGQWLATASSDGTARVWDVTTGKPRTPPLRHKQGVLTARFNSDGSQLVTGSYDSTARVWDATTGEAICVLDQGPVGWVPSALFSRDGKSVYTGGGANGAGRVCVWEVPSGRLLMNKAGGSQVLLALPCRDGRYIITTSLTGDAKVWDAGSGRIALPSLKHGGVINHAVLHPDDHRLLTAGNDGIVRVWDLSPEQSFLPCNDAPSSVVNVSPDGAYLAGFNRRGELEVWDTVKWKIQGSSLPVTNNIRYASLSSDAERLLVVTASNGNDLMAAVWQLGASRLLYECRVPSGGARLFSASADCAYLAIARDQSDEVWDLAHFKKLWGPVSRASRVSALQFGPLRDQLIIGYGSTLHVCEGTTGRALFDIQQDVNLSFACFSPDGSWIATGCGDANTDLREAKLWSASTGEVFGLAMKHPFGVGWIAFSPDGRRVGTVGTHLARVWDVKTREPVSPPLRHWNIRFLQFSPDGNQVITASEDAARVWNIETGEPLTPLLPHEKISGAYFLGHGECAVTLGAGGAKFWDLSPDLRPIDDLIALAWAHASRKVDATGSPAPLQAAEMEAAWLRARAAAKR